MSKSNSRDTSCLLSLSPDHYGARQRGRMDQLIRVLCLYAASKGLCISWIRILPNRLAIGLSVSHSSSVFKDFYEHSKALLSPGEEPAFLMPSSLASTNVPCRTEPSLSFTFSLLQIHGILKFSRSRFQLPDKIQVHPIHSLSLSSKSSSYEATSTPSSSPLRNISLGPVLVPGTSAEAIYRSFSYREQAPLEMNVQLTQSLWHQFPVGHGIKF